MDAGHAKMESKDGAHFIKALADEFDDVMNGNDSRDVPDEEAEEPLAVSDGQSRRKVVPNLKLVDMGTSGRLREYMFLLRRRQLTEGEPG